MSVIDQKQFLASIHPFDTLTPRQMEHIIGVMDIAYYPQNEILITPQKLSDRLFLIIKGIVLEYEDDEVVGVYQPLDTFDAQGLLNREHHHLFRVDEELLCYELPAKMFLELTAENRAFKSYYLEDMATRIREFGRSKETEEFSSFMIARVRDAYLHRPYIADADVPVIEAIQGMEQEKAKTILVRGGEKLGIVSDTDIRRKLLLVGESIDIPVGNIATFPVVGISTDAFLFNALLLMTRHAIKRLIVFEKGSVVGILEQMDLLSYFSNHSHLVAVQISKARNLDELERASRDIIYLIRTLNVKGVKVRYITKLVSELNQQVYRKLFDMIIPEAWHERCALVIMGSEGRHEQILKTDQDNALILEEGFEPEDLEAVAARFIQTLEQFGFPPCPGNLMITNADWRQSAEAFKRRVDDWIDTPTSGAMMDLAIFMDGICVAGVKGLFEEVKEYTLIRLENHPTMLAMFARAVENFETPLSLFANFITGQSGHKDELDLKKGGIFPLVHGVRSLAMERKIPQTNTVERIKTLNNEGVIDRAFATELIEAFNFLLTLRLKTHLEKLDRGGTLDNFVNPNRLNKLERDLLKDSFRIVNAFKKFVTYHFKLNMVG